MLGLVSVVRVSVKRQRYNIKHRFPSRKRCRVTLSPIRCDQVNERYLTYQERGYWLMIGSPPCSENYPPAGVDRQKEMVELTAAGLIPPRVLGRNGDDFHQGGLKSEMSRNHLKQTRVGALSLVPVICLVAGLHM